MTQEEILSRLQSEISSEFDKSVGSFFYDVNKPVSEEFETVYGQLEDILKNGFAKTAEGKYLDNKVLEQGLTRKPATAASVTVKITGSPGSIISIGDKVASDEHIFSVLENAVLDENGTAYVTAGCDTLGKSGNVPAGAVNKFPVTLPGLISVTNEAAAEGGYDAETDEELRERYFEKVSLPAASGSKYHYIQWAKEVSGVGDAKCLPLWNGNGTVKVIIVNADRGAANAELIEKVRQHIEESRPIGATVTVESASPLVVNISVSLVLSGAATAENVKTEIERSITKYLQHHALSGTYISYAQIGGCILSCDGVLDYSNLKLNNETQNISLSDTQVPVLGVVSVA